MSFLFKSKKNQASGLPQATREISSSHGAGTNIPAANGMSGFQQPRGPSATPGSNSNNNSLSSIPGLSGSPEPTRMRDRADSEPVVNAPGAVQVGRIECSLATSYILTPVEWATRSLIKSPDRISIPLVANAIQLYIRQQPLPSIWPCGQCFRRQRRFGILGGWIGQLASCPGRSVDGGGW
jgi:hypothetical protein